MIRNVDAERADERRRVEDVLEIDVVARAVRRRRS